MPRQLDGWLQHYLEYTEDSESPILFQKWTGISMIAACLQRKCWHTWEKRIYPNMYIVLVGPSGSRKGTAMGPGRDFLLKLGVHLSADSLTRESLIARMSILEGSYLDKDGDTIGHNSLTIFSPELAVFIGINRPELISALTDWYDCPDRWQYETRSHDVEEISKTFVNMIGATTPDLLQTTLPQDAIGGGLTSRMIFVFADKPSKLVIFPQDSKEMVELRDQLLIDLSYIMNMAGEFAMTPEYRELYKRWRILDNESKAIQDPNFEPYLTRRSTHLRKLSMITSASRGDDFLLTAQDFAFAEELLLEVEVQMPRVFSGYGRRDLAQLFPRIMAFIAERRRVRFKTISAFFVKDFSTDEIREVVASLAAMDNPFCSLEIVKGESWVTRLKAVGSGEPHDEIHHKPVDDLER